jgi:prenyl protein peptidase
LISSLITAVIITTNGQASLLDALKLLGWWPVGPLEILQSLLLTAILFAGPLFERGIAEGDWRRWIRGQGLSETLRSWIGFRNFVAVSIH